MLHCLNSAAHAHAFGMGIRICKFSLVMGLLLLLGSSLVAQAPLQPNIQGVINSIKEVPIEGESPIFDELGSFNISAQQLRLYETENVSPQIKAYSGPVIFNGIAPIVSNARILFTLMGFFFVAWGIYRAGKADDPAQMYRLLVASILVVGITASIDDIVFGSPVSGDEGRYVGRSGGLATGFDAMGDLIAPDTLSVAQKLFIIADSFQHTEIGTDEMNRRIMDQIQLQYGEELGEGEDGATEATAIALRTAGGLFGPMLDIWNWLSGHEGLQSAQEKLAEMVQTPVHMVHAFIREISMRILAFAVAGLVSLVLLLASFIIAIMESIRHFLLLTMSIMLPVFLAGLLSESWRGACRNFILQFIGVLAWPIGWALGNLGTLMGFRILCNRMIEPILQFQALSQGVAAHGAGGWGSSAIENGGIFMRMAVLRDTSLGQIVGSQFEVINGSGATAPEYFQVMAYVDPTWAISLIGMTLALLLWILFTTIMIPALMNSLIANGSSFYHGATMQTANQVQNLAYMAVAKSVGAGMLANAVAKGTGSGGSGGGSAPSSGYAATGGSAPWSPTSPGGYNSRGRGGPRQI